LSKSNNARRATPSMVSISHSQMLSRPKKRPFQCLNSLSGRGTRTGHPRLAFFPGTRRQAWPHAGLSTLAQFRCESRALFECR
jgi:hypothetical protein